MFSGHNSQRCSAARRRVAGARQQSRRAVVSSLTPSCFDRQHTCILVESLVGDDPAAPCVAHTGQGRLWHSRPEKPPDHLPGGRCSFFQQKKLGKKADYAIYLFRSGVLRVSKLDDWGQNVLKLI